MKYIVICNNLALFITVFLFGQNVCDMFDSDTHFTLTTTDSSKRWLPKGLLSDEYSESYCMKQHLKCLEKNNLQLNLIGVWDLFNSKWKFHTLCEIKNSKCVLDRTVYRHNLSGYNTWILV